MSQKRDMWAREYSDQYSHEKEFSISEEAWIAGFEMAKVMILKELLMHPLNTLVERIETLGEDDL